MGMFDRVSRRRRPEPVADLREALIAAFCAEQYEVMKDLINANVEAIRESFPKWTTAPDEIANDPVALERYARTLITIAGLFEGAGDASLMNCLRLGEGNPLAALETDVARAQTLIDEKRPAEAVTLLRTALASLDQLTGSAVEYWRPILLGRLGLALVDTGDRREAARVTKEALELCQLSGDEEGIRAYKKNLIAIGTYQIPANDGTDSNVTVAFRDEQGRTLTRDELRTVNGPVKWEVLGGGSVSPEAERLHQEGRAAGARHDYKTALSLLTRAAELAPSWAYPFYDRAFTHLLLKDFDAALRDYRKTVELAPAGFYTADVAVDTLTRESTGELFRGFYAVFAMFEHMEKDQQRSFAAQLVEKFPSFAPGWNAHADFVEDPLKRLEVIENGLAARPDRHTRGFLMVKKALAMSRLGDVDGASRMLQTLASDSTGSLSTRTLAEIALARLSSPPSL